MAKLNINFFRMDSDNILCGRNCEDELIPLTSLTDKFPPQHLNSEKSKVYHIPGCDFCMKLWSIYFYISLFRVGPITQMQFILNKLGRPSLGQVDIQNVQICRKQKDELLRIDRERSKKCAVCGNTSNTRSISFLRFANHYSYHIVLEFYNKGLPICKVRGSPFQWGA